MSKITTVLCDLDGVLTDLEAHFAETIGGPAKLSFHQYIEQKGEAYTWAVVGKRGPTWWSTMPWTPNGKAFFKQLQSICDSAQVNLEILSTPTRSKSSWEGKRMWCEKNLGPNVSVNLMYKKEKIAAEDKMLIDDREKILVRWEANGGIPMLYKDSEFSEILRKVEERLRIG